MITKLLDAMKSLAPSYIYDPKKAKKKRMMKMKKGICPDLLSIWTNATTILSPVQRSIPSSAVQYPTVDWSTVNKRFVANIPTPTPQPCHGCSEDPQFYETMYERSDYGNMMNIGSKFTNDFPFGSVLGFLTDAGPISVPNHVFHGHVYDARHGWILHAEIQERKNVPNHRTQRTRMKEGRQRG